VGLGLLSDEDAVAIRFEIDERGVFSKFLCTRSLDLGAVSADLYALAGSGSVLVTWDHHTAAEGLSIQLLRVPDAGRLLTTLNELGTELEFFYVDDGVQPGTWVTPNREHR
jgi:hypothetical protein